MSENSGDFATFTAPGTTPKINSIFDFSAEALGQLKLWLEQSGLNIGVNQVIGFSQFTPFVNEVSPEQATSSTSYTDLSTSGPTLTGLSAGSYVVFFGSSMTAPASQTSYMTVYANGADATNPVETQVGTNASLSRGFTTRLTGSNNTLQAKYKVSGGANGTFRYRWLIAIKYDN